MPNFIYLPSPPNIIVVQTITNLASDKNTPYGDCNLGLHVGDNSTNVHQNRLQLLADLQKDFPNLQQIHWLNQVHSNAVHEACDILSHLQNADAHITMQNHTALAIMTADCVPIMLFNGEKLGAIHAGWQGLAKKIIANTVKKMQTPQKNAWQAWIGACIGQANYEVDERVKQALLITFDNQVIDIEKIFKPTRAGHYQVDLAKIAELQLYECGVSQVYQSGFDSFVDDRFYSYRKQTQNHQVATGRMATLIFKNC